GIGDLEVVVSDRFWVEAPQQPDLRPGSLVAREPLQRVEVAGVERQHEIDAIQVLGLEDLRAVLGEIETMAAGDGGGTVIRALTDVPGTGPGRAHLHPAVEPRLADLVADDRLSDRRPADVPAADDTDR